MNKRSRRNPTIMATHASNILFQLASWGPMNRYNLLKTKQVGPPVAFYELIKYLQKDPKLIRIARTERHVTGGTPSEYYELTSNGLIFLLSTMSFNTDAKERTDFSKLAVKYPILPQVFGAWNEFKRFKMEDLAINRLVRVASRIMPSPEQMLTLPEHKRAPQTTKHDIEVGETFLASMVDGLFFEVMDILASSQSEAEKEAWMEMLRCSSSLRPKSLRKLEKASDEAKRLIETNEWLITYLNGSVKWAYLGPDRLRLARSHFQYFQV